MVTKINNCYDDSKNNRITNIYKLRQHLSVKAVSKDMFEIRNIHTHITYSMVHRLEKKKRYVYY